jgi:hypothetical protein
MRLCHLLLAGLLWLPLLAAPPARALDLAALVREVEQQYHGVSSHALTDMTVRTANWERTLSMEAWSLGRDYFLVRIVEPAKERGVATLKRDNEVWNYLPKVDRTIKIPPSMMGGSWMGSHITNDDLVKANHVDEDYTFRLLAEDDWHWLIECTPKPEAAVIWGKIIYRLGKQPRVPLQIDYYDEEQERVREIRFDAVQRLGNRTVPLRLTVTPLDKPGEQTILHYRQLTFDLPLERGFFNLRSLQKN